MLKLIKYELIHSYRTFTLAFLIYLGFSAILPIIYKNDEIDLGFGLLFFGYGTLIIVLMISLFITIIYQFYKSMYSKNGYLTLTLPVSSYELIAVKAISSLIWFIIGMFVLAFGFVIFAYIESDQSLITLFTEIGDFIKNSFDFTVIADFFEYILAILVFILNVYFVVTVVHTCLFRKRRLIWGFVIYIVLNMLINFIYGLFGAIPSSTLLISTSIISNVLIDSESMVVVNFLNVLQVIIFYCLTTYMLDHSIELD